MENWLDLVADTEGLRAVYGEEVPALDEVEVHEVRLYLDSLRVRFDLESYPSGPPAKWKAKKANTVQVELSFSPILEVAVTGWGWNGRASLSLEPRFGAFAVRLEGPEVKLFARSEFARVMSMSAYINGDRPPA